MEFLKPLKSLIWRFTKAHQRSAIRTKSWCILLEKLMKFLFKSHGKNFCSENVRTMAGMFLNSSASGENMHVNTRTYFYSVFRFQVDVTSIKTCA